VLIEEFIDGREISVGVIGNGSNIRILPALEFLFPDATCPEECIRSYEYKWGGRKEVMVEASLDPATMAILRSWTLLMFKACECRDYARMDFRVTSDRIFLLEVNYNPGIGPNSHGLNNTLTMMASFEGRSFEALVIEIVETAAARASIAPRLPRPLRHCSTVPNHNATAFCTNVISLDAHCSGEVRRLS
jgi:D-alanine-D-alanine ligase